MIPGIPSLPPPLCHKFSHLIPSMLAGNGDAPRPQATSISATPRVPLMQLQFCEEPPGDFSDSVTMARPGLGPSRCLEKQGPPTCGHRGGGGFGWAGRLPGHTVLLGLS